MPTTNNHPPTVELRPYQADALRIAGEHDRFGFYFDTGTGKTRVGVGVIREDENPHRWVVVTPREVIPGWLRECAAQAVPVEPTDAWRTTGGPGVRITTPQMLVRHAQKILRGRRCLVFDESSWLCNPKTKISKIVLSAPWDRVYLLSGNPAPNGPFHLWVQARLLGATNEKWWHWANLYGYQDRFRGWHPRRGAAEKILELMRPVSWYLDKKQVLPIEEPTFALREFAAGEGGPTWEGLVAWARRGGNAMLLREVASGFVYDNEGRDAIWGHDARIDACCELLEEHVGKRVVVWVQFVATRERLLERLRSSGRQVTDSVAEFLTSVEGTVFIAHPRSAGYGVDGMQHVCDTMIFCEPSYSYDEYYQAVSRLVRSGQTRPVVVWGLCAENSVDEKAWDCVQKKKNLADALREALEREVKDAQ